MMVMKPFEIDFYRLTEIRKFPSPVLQRMSIGYFKKCSTPVMNMKKHWLLDLYSSLWELINFFTYVAFIL